MPSKGIAVFKSAAVVAGPPTMVAPIGIAVLKSAETVAKPRVISEVNLLPDTCKPAVTEDVPSTLVANSSPAKNKPAEAEEVPATVTAACISVVKAPEDTDVPAMLARNAA